MVGSIKAGRPQPGRGRPRSRGRRRSAGALVVLALMSGVGAGAGRAGAEGPDVGGPSGEGPNIHIPGQRWTTSFESRAFEGQANIPFDLRYGQPAAVVDLINPPVVCEVYAAQYYAGSLAEEGVLGTTGLYYNRTLARARNPQDGGSSIGGAPQRTPKVETGPGSREAGPYALAECADRASGHGFARGAGAGGAASGPWSETEARADPKAKVVRGRSVSEMAGAVLESGAVVQHIHSSLETTHPLGAEPRFTFELRVEGVSAGGKEIVGAGREGLVFAGTGLTGPEAVAAFNQQANSQSAALEALLVYGLKVAEPKFFVDTYFDRFNFEAPVLEGSLAVPARKGTVGEYQAGRFGVNNYRGAYLP